MARPQSPSSASASVGNLRIEARLWLTARKLRNDPDAAECSHAALGLILLKCSSDTIEAQRARL